MSDEDDECAPAGMTGDEWQEGCPPADLVWVERYGFLDFPAEMSNPVDALPPGYAAYTAVLHSLPGPGPDATRRWIAAPTADPWQVVQSIVAHGIGSDRFAADRSIGQPEARILADELALAGEDRLTATYFFPPRCGTASGAALTRLLAAADHQADDSPTLWFPRHRRWIASAPYDAGWTYLASDATTAARLRANSDIEALACTYLI